MHIKELNETRCELSRGNNIAHLDISATDLTIVYMAFPELLLDDCPTSVQSAATAYLAEHHSNLEPFEAAFIVTGQIPDDGYRYLTTKQQHAWQRLTVGERIELMREYDSRSITAEDRINAMLETPPNPIDYPGLSRYLNRPS